MFKPEIIGGGKVKKQVEAKKVETHTVDESTIEEERVFSREEILDVLKQITEKENIKPSQVEITNETYDNEGNLLILRAKVKEGRALGEGWESIEYDYIIKGKHKGKGSSKFSQIDRIHNSDDPDAMQVAIVAKFEDGEWKITPGEILPKVKNI